MIKRNPAHDTDHPAGQIRNEITLADYVEKVQTEESGCYPGCFYYSDSCFRDDCKKKAQQGLTKDAPMCYTITTGMSLRDFKDGLGQAYWNRDRETLERLLDSLVKM